ncbi:hypothetical protein SAMN05216283_10626 [Sunxiuqinia elliptica]|uniref:Uncharacterized protein n=1 Tax=Sunxiuqinia elliptica TaxID=655355 RepID=A0A1I2IJM8_9BACT|nr:hypothetical protein SAMN05216283_10626 [Sunxiuqinia elliptica]
MLLMHQSTSSVVNQNIYMPASKLTGNRAVGKNNLFLQESFKARHFQKKIKKMTKFSLESLHLKSEYLPLHPPLNNKGSHTG